MAAAAGLDPVLIIGGPAEDVISDILKGLSQACMGKMGCYEKILASTGVPILNKQEGVPLPADRDLLPKLRADRDASEMRDFMTMCRNRV